MLVKCIEESEQTMKFFEELVNDLVSPASIELKLRRFYDYSAGYALVNEMPAYEAPQQNFFLIQSPSFTFMQSNSSKNGNRLGNPTPNFNAEISNLAFPGQTMSKPGLVPDNLPPNNQSRSSSTNPMRPYQKRENTNGNCSFANQSSDTLNNKIKVDEGWTLEKLAQNFDECEQIPEITNKQQYDELMKSARKSLPFKVNIQEPHYPDLNIMEGRISDIPVQNDNISEEFEDGEGYFDGNDSDYNFEITSHSSNETSNGPSESFVYRDENGNEIGIEGGQNMSKFIEDHQNSDNRNDKDENMHPKILNMLSGNKTPTQYCVIDKQTTPSQNFTPQVRRLYYGNKKIPRWAEDMEEISRIAHEQKKTGLHFSTFGVIVPITNLDIEAILGPLGDKNIDRSESIMWLTPESIDRRGQKANVAKVMRQVNMKRI
jgi:hypothetical protein